MYLGFGWAVIQPSQEGYIEFPAESDAADQLDALLESKSRQLFSDCKNWLSKIEDPFFKWEFEEQLNWQTNILQFRIARNREPKLISTLFEYLAKQSDGNYGYYQFFDDEIADASFDTNKITLLAGEVTFGKCSDFAPMKNVTVNAGNLVN